MLNKLQNLHRSYVRCWLPVNDGVAGFVAGLGTVTKNEFVNAFADGYSESYLVGRKIVMQYINGDINLSSLYGTIFTESVALGIEDSIMGYNKEVK